MSQRGKRDSYYIIAHKVGRNKREGGGQRRHRHVKNKITEIDVVQPIKRKMRYIHEKQ